MASRWHRLRRCRVWGRGTEPGALDGVDAIVQDVASRAQPGDVVLVMSNGDFGNIWQKLLDSLARVDR